MRMVDRGECRLRTGSRLQVFEHPGNECGVGQIRIGIDCDYFHFVSNQLAKGPSPATRARPRNVAPRVVRTAR